MYYIRDKKSGEYQFFGYDEGYYDEDSDRYRGEYWYLIDEDKSWASEFYSYEQALFAIEDAEESLDDYEIVLERVE